MCDPWLEGGELNGGWKVLSPSIFRYEDFARITHIWFSHEHPDHFSPSNLKRIPEELRRKITVLFHQTKDKRVLKVCEAYRFEVQELPDAQPVELAGDFRLVCGRQGLIDPWTAVFAENKTLLNMDECVVRQPDEPLPHKRKLCTAGRVLPHCSMAEWVEELTHGHSPTI